MSSSWALRLLESQKEYEALAWPLTDSPKELPLLP